MYSFDADTDAYVAASNDDDDADVDVGPDGTSAMQDEGSELFFFCWLVKIKEKREPRVKWGRWAAVNEKKNYNSLFVVCITAENLC